MPLMVAMVSVQHAVCICSSRCRRVMPFSQTTPHTVWTTPVQYHADPRHRATLWAGEDLLNLNARCNTGIFQLSFSPMPRGLLFLAALIALTDAALVGQYAVTEAYELSGGEPIFGRPYSLSDLAASASFTVEFPKVDSAELRLHH